MSIVQVIDIASYQGAVDFTKVKASGVRAVICKATEGTTFVDAWFARNWAGIKAAELIRGAYHFGRPRYPASAQAEHFVRTVGPLSPGDLPYVLDIEVADGQTSMAVETWIAAFIRCMRELTGRTPIIYTGPGFWAASVKSTMFGVHPLWVAHYTSRPAPTIPMGWDRWHIWQHTSDGQVPGITGRVDCNRVEEGVLHALAGRVEAAGTDGLSEIVTAQVERRRRVRIGEYDFVDVKPRPDGGVWGLQADGGIINVPPAGPFWGSESERFAKENRRAIGIDVWPSANPQVWGYVIIDATGATYHHPAG